MYQGGSKGSRVSRVCGASGFLGFDRFRGVSGFLGFGYVTATRYLIQRSTRLESALHGLGFRF